jgi:hypothetical protein
MGLHEGIEDSFAGRWARNHAARRIDPAGVGKVRKVAQNVSLATNVTPRVKHNLRDFSSR